MVSDLRNSKTRVTELQVCMYTLLSVLLLSSNLATRSYETWTPVRFLGMPGLRTCESTLVQNEDISTPTSLSPIFSSVSFIRYMSCCMAVPTRHHSFPCWIDVLSFPAR
ncbi:hypothetical protein CMEL01_01015 [Colletotrichum melonis]|uniref:Uncharacterized protein n=1 Tax=Colletotrichum melonis TaxID=1209925 RepID=A0AAI9V7R3_9PEZI|nr:hypothetical protein CMEL01_01015 [Colletotrichum melonis]